MCIQTFPKMKLSLLSMITSKDLVYWSWRVLFQHPCFSSSGPMEYHEVVLNGFPVNLLATRHVFNPIFILLSE